MKTMPQLLLQQLLLRLVVQQLLVFRHHHPHPQQHRNFRQQEMLLKNHRSKAISSSSLGQQRLTGRFQQQPHFKCRRRRRPHGIGGQWCHDSASSLRVIDECINYARF